MARSKDDDTDPTSFTIPAGTPWEVVEGVLGGVSEGIMGGAEQRTRQLHERATGKKPFATLADDFRAALIDTKRMGYPLEVLEPEVRRRADAACRSILPILHKAHRIVLDADYTRLAARRSAQPPVDLARFLDLARLPFNHLWIEWPQPERSAATIGVNYLKDTDIPQRVGLLIWPTNTAGLYHLIDVSAYNDTCAPAPIGMIFSLTQEIHDFDAPNRVHYEGADERGRWTIEESPIGYNYMEEVRKHYPDQVSLGAAINRHAWLSVAPPFGPLHRETIEKARAAGDEAAVDRQASWMGVTAREINGLFRFLLCVFGLYNTGGTEDRFTVSETRKQGKQAFRMGTLPAYEYRVLKLKRPTTPEIVTKKLPSTSSLGRRYHTVSGSWHHQRLGTAECSRHPKVCPIAVWHKVVDEETGEGVGSDQQECGICHRVKWWVSEHPRGNKALGTVDKGYEVTASPDARPGMRREEVVTSLPPGIRLKSIHRIEATLHGEKSDEHPSRRRHPRAE